MMNLQHPEALLLIPVWLLCAWLFPGAKLFRPLRVIAFALVVLAWMNPFVDRTSRGLDLWVLVDRSESASPWIEPRLPEMHALLEQSRGRHDRLRYIDFAEGVIERDPLQHALLSGRMNSTRIGTALHFTLSRLDPRRSSRLLLITDGYSTEPLDDVAIRLAGQGVPLDVRFMQPADDLDFRVSAIQAPMRVRPNEPFLVEARITGGEDTAVPCILYRDGAPIARTTVHLRNGMALARWTDSISGYRAVEYRVVIEPERDAWAGNNQQAVWVEARGGQRVVLVTAYANDPIADALTRHGVTVDVIENATRFYPGHLAGASSVILNNVPAYALPNDTLAALPFYVHEAGGGLIMVGGRHSFAVGGYFESPIDELLPVSMELKQEHRRLAVAMAIVLDRSGSMMAGVPGSGGKTKMDLANEGTARAIELLGDQDAVTVFAVDSEPHRIVPLTTLGENRQRLLGLVRRIQSAGGGIFVYVGLKAGWDEIKGARQGQRHIILFSDAADSERPEGYERLIDEMKAAGASLSIIALGTEKDSDADLLKQIAARAGGRIFFNADADSLPALFAQETVALSRSAFLNEPVKLLPQAGWFEMAADMMNWPAQVDGYNLCYVRPGAATSLTADDEYEAPLLAQWARGAGKVAAVTFPLAGDYSRTVRSWDAYGDFIRTLTRWSLRDDAPNGLGLRLERMGETIRLELHHDEEWLDVWAESPPVLVTTMASRPDAVKHSWRRIKPGVFEAEVRISGDDAMSGVIQAGRHVIPFGPIAGMLGAEWSFDPAMPAALTQMAIASGGQIRFDLEGVWNAAMTRERRGIRDWLLILALSVFVIEALLTRLDWQFPGKGSSIRQVKPMIKADAVKTMPSSSIKPPEAIDTNLPPPSRKSMFDKARHRGRL
ncbi:MAG TPA: VWA domain-containing protein [Kiritimatiellia bacterium]|nr:VWA domain-containing protein [Kiritimatiellia bacterium]